jgi:hypothetical protein
MAPLDDVLPETQAERLLSSRCTMHIWRPVRGMVVSRVAGVLTREAGAAYEQIVRRAAAEEGKILLFNDWERMTDYDTEVRMRLVGAGSALRDAIEAHHVYTRSRIVALALQWAHLVNRKIVGYDGRVTFDVALRETLQRRREEARRTSDEAAPSVRRR